MQLQKFFLFLSIFAMLLGRADAANKPARAIPKQLFCPNVQTIVRNPKTLMWKAPRGWEGHNISFAKKIQTFIGAQWVGAKVGQITCVYEPFATHTFPVLLASNYIVFEPTGKHWNKKHAGYRNCVARKVKDCPFKPLRKRHPKNIFKSLENIKPLPSLQDPEP